jgi:hypothetical protein
MKKIQKKYENIRYLKTEKEIFR